MLIQSCQSPGLDGPQSDVHLNTQHYSLNSKGIKILTFNRAAVILGVIFDCVTTPSKETPQLSTMTNTL